MQATRDKSNFSASELHDVYSKLEEIFGKDNVLFIGGRAINLLCEKNQRPTHDIDVAVIVPKDKIIDIKSKAIEKGFIIHEDNRGRLTSLDIKTHEGKPMQIDLYYSRQISGIPIDYLFETSIEIKKFQGNETYSFKVANPGVLLVLKFFAYNKADKDNKEKHWNDINSLLYRYDGVDNFFSEFGDVIKVLFSDQNYELFKRRIENIIDMPPLSKMLRR
ncbi:MAG: nucleotidyl transferase AbiEii/AbiGii toxin family protein [Candidatus Micrarchaeota archaeon]